MHACMGTDPNPTAFSMVQLYRRYGSRRVPSSHPMPAQQEAAPVPVPDRQSKDKSWPGADQEPNVAGRSPDSDMSASQYSSNSGFNRFVRLYPDEDLTQPMEPGTPSNESTMATQQLWDALSRGRASAYRVRTLCNALLPAWRCIGASYTCSPSCLIQCPAMLDQAQCQGMRWRSAAVAIA